MPKFWAFKSLKCYRSIDLIELGDLEFVGGYLDLQDTKVKSLGKVKVVKGYLDLKGTPIEDLSDLEVVEGHLNLNGTPIVNLGKLKKVLGNVYLANTPLETLGNLEEVEGDIILGTNINDLGALKKVGETIFMERTKVKSLGKLNFVGGWMVITNTPLARNMTDEQISANISLGREIIRSKKYVTQNFNSQQLGLLSIAFMKGFIPKPTSNQILWESLANGHCKLYFEMGYYDHLSQHLERISNNSSGSINSEWQSLFSKIQSGQEIENINEDQLSEYTIPS